MNIVRRRVAGQTGFGYSPAMRAFAERHDVWSKDLLDRYIADPESLVELRRFRRPSGAVQSHGVSESANAITRTRIVRPMRNVVVLFLLILTTPTFADTEAAWAALRAGTAVALMRHADAPGIGDPAGYRLEDCSTQRNLSERGKAQAAAVGALFRSNHIAIATIISSPWCRCLETARLMEVGPVSVDPAFSNAFVLTDQRDELKRRGSAVISAWKSGNLLVVTHGSNIAALSGLQLAPAEILVVEPGAIPPRVVGRISPPR